MIFATREAPLPQVEFANFSDDLLLAVFAFLFNFVVYFLMLNFLLAIIVEASPGRLFFLFSRTTRVGFRKSRFAAEVVWLSMPNAAP